MTQKSMNFIDEMEQRLNSLKDIEREILEIESAIDLAKIELKAASHFSFKNLFPGFKVRTRVNRCLQALKTIKEGEKRSLLLLDRFKNSEDRRLLLNDDYLRKLRIRERESR